MVERALVMFKLAFRNVLLNWRHSLATMLAISLGYAAIALFDGFMGHIRSFVIESYVSRGMLGHVVIQRTGARAKVHDDHWQATLKEEEHRAIVKLIEGDPRIVTVARFLAVSGVAALGSGKQAVFIGVGHDIAAGEQLRGDKWLWNTIAGRPLNVNDSSAALIGMGLARRLNCAFDNKDAVRSDGGYKPIERRMDCPAASIQLSVTTEALQVNALEMKPVGVIDMLIREYNDRFVMMPLATVQSLADSKRVDHISVLLKDPSDETEFVNELSERVKNAGIDAEVLHWIDFPAAAPAKGGIEILAIFRALFLSVVGIIAAMSVANSMMKSINERVREIGTLRSYGFRQLDILQMFLAEGLLLGFFSCMVGLAFAALVGAVISSSGVTFNTGIMSDSTPLKVQMSLTTWLTTLLTLCLVTTATSWLVSRKAARMVIADALRHVA